MRLQYSFIIPTCNRAKLLGQFLQSVERQTILPYEVIVIDQSDDKATRDLFEQWNLLEGAVNPSINSAINGEVLLRGNPEPRQGGVERVKKKYVYREVKSLILARHAGLDACDETDLVVFFDDDITLDPLFCEEMVKVFEKDSDGRFAGGMGAVDGWQYRAKPFQSFFLMPHEGDGRFLASGAQTFPHWKKEFCETEFLSGGCTFWRREIIQKYRFDERLSGYGFGDDTDVSYRVSRRYKLFFQPRAVCFQERGLHDRAFTCEYRRAWIQNMFYLVQKNKFSMLAYAWCILGHFLRDLICLDFFRFYGDLKGTWNVLCNRIDTVIGYEEFQRRLS